MLLYKIRLKPFWLQIMTNGANKQGGVLSPILFCVNLNELLLALSAVNVGCYVGDNFVGALACADDCLNCTTAQLRKC